jgi:hypothetical protein
MDSVSKDVFDSIVRHEPHELSQTDIDFLRARRSYLNAAQREKFGKLLLEESEPKQEAPEPKPKEESKKKKSE